MNKQKRFHTNSTYFLLMIAAILAMLLLNISFGSVNISFTYVFQVISGGYENNNEIWNNIIFYSRLPQSITAIFAGSGLAVGGLMMQTLFRNPLAGPSVLGISSGASLGVAFVTMFTGSWAIAAMNTLGFYTNIIVMAGAFIGALLSLFIILALSYKINNNAMLLVAGIMIGYITSAMIDILKFYGLRDNVHSFVLWGLGNFSNVTWDQLYYLIPVVSVGLIFSALLIKPLDMLQLGDNYAKNLGLKVHTSRILIILCTGLLTAIITAFCGPIAFLGLAVPHLTKLIFRSTGNKVLIPAVILNGAFIALVCNFISRLPGLETALPVNAVTSLFGAPVVISIILRKNNLQYSN